MTGEKLEFLTSDVFCDVESIQFADPRAPIFLGSVFPGTLSNPRHSIDRSVVLDTNILSEIRNNPSGPAARALVGWAERSRVHLDPTYALMEQRVSHGNPGRALEQYVEVLRDTFGHQITRASADQMNALLESKKSVVEHNMGLLRDYLPLIKRIWKDSGDTAKKASVLAKHIVSADLPRFTFAFFFACVAFRSRDRDGSMSEEERDKIAKDMGISPQRDREAKRLTNLAFDMSIFTVCPEIVLRPSEQDVVFLTKIASLDRSFSAYIRNIKCPLVWRVPGSHKQTSSIAGWALQPGEDFPDSLIQEIARTVPKDVDLDPAARSRRRSNLTRFAAELLE
jgi:hypothetical protein